MLPVIAALSSACSFAPTRRQLDRTLELASPQATNSIPQSHRVSARPDTPVDLSARLQRDTLIAEALIRSPILAMMRHRARALVYAGRSETALPVGELGVQIWNLPIERPYALGEADMYMVELRQRFPPNRALDARARAMAHEAEATIAELAAEERIITERIDTLFSDYCQIVAERRVQERRRALLLRFLQTIRARYSTGGSALVEVSRIEAELAGVDRALARTNGDHSRVQSALNAILRRRPGSALGEPLESAPMTVRLSLSELLARAEANRGTILAARARIRASVARREAAESEARIPEFMIGLGYWQAPAMRAGFGVSASMSLPWLWGPTRDRVRQSAEEESAERYVEESARVDIQTEVGEAHARLAALESQLTVIRAQALPAARRSMEALAAGYSTGGSSLLEWLDVARSVIELELDLVMLTADLQRVVANLERAVGANLPRVSLESGPTP